MSGAGPCRRAIRHPERTGVGVDEQSCVHGLDLGAGLSRLLLLSERKDGAAQAKGSDLGGDKQHLGLGRGAGEEAKGKDVACDGARIMQVPGERQAGPSQRLEADLAALPAHRCPIRPAEGDSIE